MVNYKFSGVLTLLTHALVLATDGQQGTVHNETTWKDAFKTCRIRGGSLYNVLGDNADDRQLWGPAYWMFTPWTEFVDCLSVAPNGIGTPTGLSHPTMCYQICKNWIYFGLQMLEDETFLCICYAESSLGISIQIYSPKYTGMCGRCNEDSYFTCGQYANESVAIFKVKDDVPSNLTTLKFSGSERPCLSVDCISNDTITYSMRSCENTFRGRCANPREAIVSSDSRTWEYLMNECKGGYLGSVYTKGFCNSDIIGEPVWANVFKDVFLCGNETDQDGCTYRFGEKFDIYKCQYYSKSSDAYSTNYTTDCDDHDRQFVCKATGDAKTTKSMITTSTIAKISPSRSTPTTIPTTTAHKASRHYFTTISTKPRSSTAALSKEPSTVASQTTTQLPIHKSELSQGPFVVIGAIVGSVFVSATIVTILVIFLRRHRRSRENTRKVIRVNKSYNVASNPSYFGGEGDQDQEIQIQNSKTFRNRNMKTFSQSEFKNLGDDGHLEMSNGKNLLNRTDGNGRLPNDSFSSDQPSANKDTESTFELTTNTCANYEFHVPLTESNSDLQSSNNAGENSNKPYSDDVVICRTGATMAPYNSVLHTIPEDSSGYSHYNLAIEDHHVSTYDQMSKLRSYNNDENEHYDHLSNKTINSLEWSIDSTYDHTPVTKETEYDLFE